MLGKTYPVEPTVAALCDGIERRAAHVYGQRWVRNVRPVRGLITGLLYAGGKRRVAKAEKLYLAEGPGSRRAGRRRRPRRHPTAYPKVA